MKSKALYTGKRESDFNPLITNVEGKSIISIYWLKPSRLDLRAAMLCFRHIYRRLTIDKPETQVISQCLVCLFIMPRISCCHCVMIDYWLLIVLGTEKTDWHRLIIDYWLLICRIRRDAHSGTYRQGDISEGQRDSSDKTWQGGGDWVAGKRTSVESRHQDAEDERG